MKIVPFAAAVALSVGLAGPLPAQRGGEEILTNQTVVSMVAGKLNRDLLVAKINTTKNTFDVTVQGLIGLHTNKVHADIVKTMIQVAGDPKLGAAPSRTPEILDNQSIIGLVSAKVPRPVILAKIQNTRANFDTSATGLVSLTSAKVPSDVIKAMIAKPTSSK
jgi:hypothetical protein